MPEGPSDEKLTRLLVIVESMNKQLTDLTADVKALKDDNYYPLDTKVQLLDQRLTHCLDSVKTIQTLTASVNVDQDRVLKLERWVYGAVAAAMTNLVALLIALVMWLVKK